MSASGEIRYKIGADTSAFSRSMVAMQSVAAAAGKQIHKKLGLQDALKSSVLAFGLSIEKIKDKLAELFTGGSQEAWKKGLESAAQSMDLIIEKQLSRLDATRQIAVLEKEIARGKADEDATPKSSGELGFLGKVASGIMGRFGGKLGPSTTRANTARESDAEAFERSQAALARRLALEKQIEEIRKSGAKVEEQVTESAAKVAEARMSDEEKLVALLEEGDALQAKIDASKVKTSEVLGLQVALNNKVAEANALQLKIEKEKADTAKKAAEDAERARRKEVLHQQQLADAVDRRTKAFENLTNARHDAVAFSLDDSATGKRGTPTDRATARRIQQAEATARRLFDSGNTVDVFENGQHRQLGFRDFQNRAEQMRGTFDKLKTDEKDPYREMQKALDDANKHLERIEQNLEPEEVD